MIRLVLAEFDKLFSTRLWLWLLLASFALTALFLSFTLAFHGAEAHGGPALDTPQGQRNLFADAGAAGVFALLLGVIAVTGEFRHQTATATFLATPSRGRVITAKLISYALVGIGLGVATVLLAIAVAVPWLGAINIELSLTSNGIPGTLAGVVGGAALFALLGVGIGALVRNQIAAVVGALVYLFVIEPFARAIPTIRDYYKYLPGGASEAMTATTDPVVAILQPWQGATLLVAYALAFAVLGSWLAMRRDVT
jgi:ABC-2 type transport system permease protein